MRRALTIGLVIALSACTGIPPNPTAPDPPAASAPPAAQFIIVGLVPATLPIGGGTAKVLIHTAVDEGNTIVAPHARVTVRATTGTLKDTELTTNGAGYAETEWSSADDGEVVISAGEIVGRATVAIERVPVNTPTPNPNPAPSPPTPSPPPTPDPGPSSGPAPLGDLVLAIVSNPTAPVPGDTVTFTPALTSSTNKPVPAIARFLWDDGSGGAPEGTEASYTRTNVALGSFPVGVFVVTTDNRGGEVWRTISVAAPPPPALTAALSTDAPSNTQAAGVPIQFTATAGSLQAGETVTLYQWDLDGNNAFDGTTMVNTRTASYVTAGTYTARVVITTSTGRTATGTVPVIITSERRR